ncbi:hypothetical protein F3Y22_tig00110017pilonHSYRG00152 [Hibiscus syriacus]|uniref:Uncharacterized protein n=1 Tax=Hibiscus syriacus TaxID=106335 RepID=A0A6A3BT88_HIBSY|nr:hypothetical protein F3Y22_tig00110017pilonHSYRG00152 [Hibiscus syriacus]
MASYEEKETLLSNLHHVTEKEEESLVEDLKKVILEDNGFGDEHLQEELQIEGNNEHL